jgi:hypothetical protein
MLSPSPITATIQKEYGLMEESSLGTNSKKLWGRKELPIALRLQRIKRRLLLERTAARESSVTSLHMETKESSNQHRH